MIYTPKQDSSRADLLVRGTKTTTLLVGLYFYITFIISFNEDTLKGPARRPVFSGKDALAKGES